MADFLIGCISGGGQGAGGGEQGGGQLQGLHQEQDGHHGGEDQEPSHRGTLSIL